MNKKKKSKKSLPPLVEISARPMGSMEFLYDFLQIEEFTEMKDDWRKRGLHPNVLIYPNKVDIWLLPY